MAPSIKELISKPTPEVVVRRLKPADLCRVPSKSLSPVLPAPSWAPSSSLSHGTGQSEERLKLLKGESASEKPDDV